MFLLTREPSLDTPLLIELMVIVYGTPAVSPVKFIVYVPDVLPVTVPEELIKVPFTAVPTNELNTLL